MPGIVVTEYMNMLPVLVAEESLHTATVLQVGSGMLEKRDHHRIVDRWRRDTKERRETPDLQPEAMANMGISVVRK